MKKQAYQEGCMATPSEQIQAFARPGGSASRQYHEGEADSPGGGKSQTMDKPLSGPEVGSPGPHRYGEPLGPIGGQGYAKPHAPSGAAPTQGRQDGHEGHTCSCCGHHKMEAGPHFSSPQGGPYGMPYPFSEMFARQFGFGPQPPTPPTGESPVYGSYPGHGPSAPPNPAMHHAEGMWAQQNGCSGRPGFGAASGFAEFPGFGGGAGFGAPSFATQYRSADPLQLDPRYGQLIAMCNDLMQGKADPMKIANFVASGETHFWKGAIVGALVTFILTNEGIKSALAESFSGLFGSKPSQTK